MMVDNSYRRKMGKTFGFRLLRSLNFLQAVFQHIVST